MITDEAAEAILDLRESCIKHNKALMYIIVDNKDPNKGIQVVTPKSVNKKDADDIIKEVLKTVKFDKELGEDDRHIIWSLIIKNSNSHRVYSFNLKGDPEKSHHMEITTIKMKDIINEEIKTHEKQ